MGPQPDGVRACLFEFLQHREQLHRRLLQSAEVVHVCSLKSAPQLGEELLRAIFINTQLFQRALVEVVLDPFLNRLNDFIGLRQLILRDDGGGQHKAGRDEENAFHIA